MGDIDFTIAAWVYLDTKTANRPILAKWNATDFEYKLEYRSGPDRFTFFVSSTGTTSVSVELSSGPNAAQWYFIIAWHDAAANTINIMVNDDSAQSVAHTLGVRDGTSSFRMGHDIAASTFMDGRVDSVSIWKELLTAAEKTWLYNGGAGRDYPF